MGIEARLIVVEGADPVVIELFLPFTVGHSVPQGLQIPHPDVASRHCEIYEFDGELAVRDLGSSAGTIVNGQRIERPTFLSPGDELTVGGVTLMADYAIPKRITIVPHDVTPSGRE